MNISPYVFPELAAQKRCKGIIPKPQYGEKIEYIETLVCSHFGQTVEEVKKKGRKRVRVLCRKIIYYFMTRHTKLTLQAMGEKFCGSQDHTTVLNALRSLNDLMSTDKELFDSVYFLEAKIDERK